MGWRSGCPLENQLTRKPKGDRRKEKREKLKKKDALSGNIGKKESQKRGGEVTKIMKSERNRASESDGMGFKATGNKKQ